MAGAIDLYDPAQDIDAGMKHLQWLQKQWRDKIPDKEEQLKFVLTSYNVGLGHLQDARQALRIFHSIGNRKEEREKHKAEMELLKKQLGG